MKASSGLWQLCRAPVGVAFVDALPLNASGKLLKTELRARSS